jgi:hypothetical protein
VKPLSLDLFVTRKATITQELTEDDEPPIPIDTVSNDPNMNRKAAKRTIPWDLAAEELLIVPSSSSSSSSSLSPQAEEILARKKPRLEEPFPKTADEVARTTTSPDVSVGLPPPAADNEDVDAYPVTDT